MASQKGKRERGRRRREGDTAKRRWRVADGRALPGAEEDACEIMYRRAREEGGQSDGEGEITHRGVLDPGSLAERALLIPSRGL